ncbi:GumC family protein [Spirosoma spitsbergense]|uniref:GumC family protein n=1 Tax=Spirosoma spitsbergense TaxID=431554 RepID=UPI0003803300|nr:hypothetical protein [Spirosoma spitsbergense]
MMNFQELGRLFRQHLIWFILFPCLGAGAIYFFMRNESRQYKTKATLYTGFTSGYSLRAAEENFHVDYSGVSNAFDNVLTTLNSTQTLYQVGINLLSEHLYLTKPAERQLSTASFQRLQQAIPATLRQTLIASGSPEITHQLIDSLAQSQTDNPVQKLLIRSGSDYTADVIGKRLKSSRRGASDMLDLEYDAEDPAIAQQTLSLAIAELNSRYSLLKRSETNPVVTYYQDNAKAAKKRLDQAETKLRSFNVAHNVLNFEDEMKNRSLTRDALVAEYNEEMMRNRATKASMDALGQRMTQGGTLLKINTQLTDKQAELMAAESQLINARANGKTQAVLDKVQARVDQLAAELKVIAQNYFAADNSSESIPRLNLISNWLDKLLGYEESSARLTALKKRMEDYQAETTTFTPLESEQRQLIRDMDVAEKEYMTLVQSLNQANTHRQDISIDGSLSVLDPPAFPLVAQPAKRWLYMALGAGAGLVVALLLAAFRALADKRINSLEQAERRIGSPISIVFPTVKKFGVNSRASRAATSMFEQLANAINLAVDQRNVPSYPPIITLFSTRSKQGKTWLAHGLARLYAESGEQIAYLYPRINDTDAPFEQENISFFPYALQANFMNIREPEDLLTNQEPLFTSTYNKIILELPPLVSRPIPLHLAKLSAVSILILMQQTVWGRRDKQLYTQYLKAIEQPVLVAFNKVDESNVDAPTLNDMEQGLPRTKPLDAPTAASTKKEKLLNR